MREVGVDEPASKRGQNYISLFVDLEARRLLYAIEGRDRRTLARFREDLEAHGGEPERIREFSLDMSPAFVKGIEASFPHAALTFDKLHVTKLLGDAVDRVRRAEKKERPELNGSRYVWLKNPDNLTQRHLARLDGLDVPSLNLKTARAYRMRLAFQELSELADPAVAEAFL